MQVVSSSTFRFFAWNSCSVVQLLDDSSLLVFILFLLDIVDLERFFLLHRHGGPLDWPSGKVSPTVFTIRKKLTFDSWFIRKQPQQLYVLSLILQTLNPRSSTDRFHSLSNSSFLQQFNGVRFISRQLKRHSYHQVQSPTWQVFTDFQPFLQLLSIRFDIWSSDRSRIHLQNKRIALLSRDLSIPTSSLDLASPKSHRYYLLFLIQKIAGCIFHSQSS